MRRQHNKRPPQPYGQGLNALTGIDYLRSSKYPWRWRPHKLGFVELKVYEEPVNGFPIQVNPILYPHPPVEIEE